MKSFIAFFILLSAYSCKCLGQTQGSHTPNTTMTAFHGTWLWVHGTKSFKIKLETRPVFFPLDGEYTLDRLVGWFEYKHGNQIICSNYNIIGNTTDPTVLVGGNEWNPQNTVEAMFKDPLKDRYNSVKLILNAGQNQISWKASEIGLIRSTAVPTPGMSTPDIMTLVKQ